MEAKIQLLGRYSRVCGKEAYQRAAVSLTPSGRRALKEGEEAHPQHVYTWLKSPREVFWDSYSCIPNWHPQKNNVCVEGTKNGLHMKTLDFHMGFTNFFCNPHFEKTSLKPFCPRSTLTLPKVATFHLGACLPKILLATSQPRAAIPQLSHCLILWGNLIWSRCSVCLGWGKSKVETTLSSAEAGKRRLFEISVQQKNPLQETQHL